MGSIVTNGSLHMDTCISNFYCEKNLIVWSFFDAVSDLPWIWTLNWPFEVPVANFNCCHPENTCIEEDSGCYCSEMCSNPAVLQGHLEFVEINNKIDTIMKETTQMLQILIIK